MGLLSFYFDRPIYIAYDKRILKCKKTLIISNHLTNYDWIYFMAVLLSLGMYNDLYIILKESLSKLPIFGYGMKCFNFIFLKRKFDEDKQILKNGLSILKKDEKFYLLIFPEGTFIDSETHVKSKAFANKLNYKIGDKTYNPNYTLIPRITGTKMIIEELKDDLDGIIDVTILSNPFEQYPQDKYTVNNVMINRKKEFTLYFILEYKKNNNNFEDMLYKGFLKKEEVLSKYKEFDRINNLEEYSEMVYKLYGDKFMYKKTYIQSELKGIFHLSGLLIVFLVLNFIFKILELKMKNLWAIKDNK